MAFWNRTSTQPKMTTTTVSAYEETLKSKVKDEYDLLCRRHSRGSFWCNRGIWALMTVLDRVVKNIGQELAALKVWVETREAQEKTLTSMRRSMKEDLDRLGARVHELERGVKRDEWNDSGNGLLSFNMATSVVYIRYSNEVRRRTLEERGVYIGELAAGGRSYKMTLRQYGNLCRAIGTERLGTPEHFLESEVRFIKAQAK